MRPHGSWKKRKYGCLVVFFLLFLVFFVYLAVFSVSDWDPMGSNKPVHLLSYEIDPKRYHLTVPGLSYDSNVDQGEPQEPTLFKLGDLLTDWPSDNTSPIYWQQSRAHPNTHHGIARFDYSDEKQRALALRFREKELPFVLTNVPEVERAISGYFTLDQLFQNFGSTPRIVEKSNSNRFMYYSARRSVDTMLSYPTWVPPQLELPLTFARFLREAERAENGPEVAGSQPLYYMTMSAGEGQRTPWVREALPSFAAEKSFFIVDPNGFKGINCRFGMKGVVAAAHYDGQRNFVAMLRGRKRYVLLPPRACRHLSLYPRGHPSARHSSVDWSDPHEVETNAALRNAEATEVVLSMGEMLYIPSFWFHYIVSQDASIQCNARSGVGKPGFEEIKECGYFEDSPEHHSMRQADKGDGSGSDVSSMLSNGYIRQGNLGNASGVIDRGEEAGGGDDVRSRVVNKADLERDLNRANERLYHLKRRNEGKRPRDRHNKKMKFSPLSAAEI